MQNYLQIYLQICRQIYRQIYICTHICRYIGRYICRYICRPVGRYHQIYSVSVFWLCQIYLAIVTGTRPYIYVFFCVCSSINIHIYIYMYNHMPKHSMWVAGRTLSMCSLCVYERKQTSLVSSVFNHKKAPAAGKQKGVLYRCRLSLGKSLWELQEGRRYDTYDLSLLLTIFTWRKATRPL